MRTKAEFLFINGEQTLKQKCFFFLLKPCFYDQDSMVILFIILVPHVN